MLLYVHTACRLFVFKAENHVAFRVYMYLLVVPMTIWSISICADFAVYFCSFERSVTMPRGALFWETGIAFIVQNYPQAWARFFGRPSFQQVRSLALTYPASSYECFDLRAPHQLTDHTARLSPLQWLEDLVNPTFPNNMAGQLFFAACVDLALIGLSALPQEWKDLIHDHLNPDRLIGGQERAAALLPSFSLQSSATPLETTPEPPTHENQAVTA